jgi:hypothetical protein
MLQDFIAANRDKIIERARQRVSDRSAPKSTDTALEHGVAVLLTQIVNALTEARTLHVVGADGYALQLTVHPVDRDLRIWTPGLSTTVRNFSIGRVS